MSLNVKPVEDAQAQGLTVGLKPLNGPNHLRLELDEFTLDVDMTNLYLLALVDLMDPKVWREPFSWFQMGGIHGRPYDPWDGVQSAGNTREGYCNHTSILFPTWHRPYIAMVEQSLFLKMAEIADRFPAPEKAQYVQAAERFRHPYWDPVVPRRVRTVNGRKLYTYGPPLICMLPRVRVKYPSSPSTYTEVDNPLYSFKFPEEVANFDTKPPMSWASVFSHPQQPHTIAAGTIRGIDSNGESDHIFVEATYGADISYESIDFPHLGGKLYNLLTNKHVEDGSPISGYGEFSNDGYWFAQGRRLGNQNSLEGFHDDIHVNTGAGRGASWLNYGMGHIGLIEYAAMDPIFWLHHTNVDRICAIWQTLWPDNWFESQRALGDTFMTSAMDVETPETPLYPFRKSGTRERPVWWNSDDVRDWTVFDYDYAIKDFRLSNVPLKSANTAAINAYVNRFYQWTTVGGPTPNPARIGYPLNLSPALNLPTVWRIDGKGAPIPHDPPAAVPPVPQGVLPLLSKNMAPAAVGTPQQVLATTTMDAESAENETEEDWFKDSFSHLGSLVKDGKMNQWSVSVKVEKFALGSSFTIYFFLGEFPPEPVMWPHAKTLAGMDGVFVNQSIENCPNCARQRDTHLVISDHIGLTTSLVKYWESREKVNDLGIASLNRDDVIPFLVRNLHWRVANASNVEIPRDQVAGLKVQVNSQIVHLPQRPEDLPRYDLMISHPEVTDGRPSGVMNDPEDQI